ncbi:hypothetical protein FRC09_004200, partial [Ceratobasidium sp. 395]
SRAQSHQDYDDLAFNLANTIGELSEHLFQPQCAQASKYVQDTISDLSRQLSEVRSKRENRGPLDYLKVSQDEDELINYYRQITILFQRLQSHAALGLWSIAQEQLSASHDQAANELINNMQPAKKARYNSQAATPIRRRQCAPNTREGVMKELRAWANDPNSAKIYWMNGMAGIGKTTVAFTLCSELGGTQQLAASFFCSRELPECRDVARIIPTIAYQLARLSPPFRSSLCRTLSRDPDISSYDVETQFNELINKPLLELRGKIPEGVLVVVIDALDECSDGGGARQVLHALFRFAGDLPIKFLVTCRPEHKLIDQLISLDVSHSLFHLHHIEQAVVQADIETYLRLELASTNLSDNQISQLAERSGNLFIYAATAVNYIDPGGVAVDHGRRLDAMLRADRNSRAHGTIDVLYSTILSTALENTALEPWELNNTRMVLYTVICAKEPVAVETLADLLKIDDANDVQLALQQLQSVLYVSADNFVSALHASFPEYLLDRERSGTFSCDHHQRWLAFRCLEVMKESLRFNICDLESSSTLDSDVPNLEDRISRAVPLHLFYACRFWAEHICEVGMEAQLVLSLEEFFSSRILFWMEVLNLKRCMTAGVIMLSTVNQFLQKNKKRCGFSDSLCDLAHDAYKFATVIAASPVSNSTPHIYVSVLALWSKSGPMWRQYGVRSQGLLCAKGSAIENRELAALATWKVRFEVLSVSISCDGAQVATGLSDCMVCVWDAQTGRMLIDPFRGHTGPVNSVAFSFDGRIASGSDDCTIRIWYACNGSTLVGPLEGHTGAVYSVAFSSDNTRIVSGSEDRTIRVWDARNGNKILGPLVGHDGCVRSVAFSPDQSRLASGSWDKTIRIWDACSGQELGGPILGHNSWISSVTFSPDSKRIASGSSDCTIRIWDAQSGGMLIGPLKGHNDYVSSVAFSPDGTRIASGSDDRTLMIWDAETGDALAGPLEGHTDWIRSVAFSPDGSRIISGSRDRTICIWDAYSKAAHPGRLGGHTDWVSSVCFSPDNSRVVSASGDFTVRIWDACNGRALTSPLSGHTEEVTSVACSPDGTRIASCSGDCTIRIWDAQSGIMQIDPLRGHGGYIYSISFSPDGRRVATGSSDRTIRVWDADTGQLLAEPFKGHTDWVRSVAFSPDGERIVSGSHDRTVIIWDARTGDAVVGPLEGHNNWVRSVAISPDGNRVASGSADRTICVWDARNEGRLLFTLSEHNGWVTSVAFSPDSNLILSGSNDRTIRVWDPYTGNLLAGPFDGHTSCVTSVAFSHDGSLIASGSDDGSIRLWDTNSIMSKDVSHLVMSKDGWVGEYGSRSYLGWVPQDLRAALKRPQNTIVISSHGSFSLQFTEALLGQDWKKCFTP